VLALHQPVAVDLRFIVAALKINNDLERIGDLAVNVAERAEWLAQRPTVETGFDFVAMADKVQWMLQKSLDAFVRVDTKLAREVREADDEVDAMNRQMYGIVEDGVKKRPDRAAELIHLLSVSRHLERVADLATNISEDVIYLAEGEIVRHKRERYEAEAAG
jgi:phosphate transport system protein